jgi:dienelactone hydrolase
VRFEYIGELLTRAGYAVLIPERRGYGRSDGPTWGEEVGRSNERVVPRLEAETDDVLAAARYLQALPFVDSKRIGIMGWSFGGVVTMFAVSRTREFAVAVNQAGGALSWNGNAAMRSALVAAAEKATTPALLLVAQNDRTTASITTVGDILTRRGVPHRMVIYEPFAPPQSPGTNAPGHSVFSAQGMHVWERARVPGPLPGPVPLTLDQERNWRTIRRNSSRRSWWSQWPAPARPATVAWRKGSARPSAAGSPDQLSLP